MLYQVRNLLYDHSAEQITLFQNAFSGQSPSLFDLPCTFLQGDHMEGVMIGGNIRCFLKLAGTDFQPDSAENSCSSKPWAAAFRRWLRFCPS